MSGEASTGVRCGEGRNQEVRLGWGVRMAPGVKGSCSPPSPAQPSGADDLRNSSGVAAHQGASSPSVPPPRLLSRLLPLSLAPPE